MSEPKSVLDYTILSRQFILLRNRKEHLTFLGHFNDKTPNNLEFKLHVK